MIRGVLTSVVALALVVAFAVSGADAQTVAGTVNAKQSGTWNITNISGTITLPTGAATSAKQPALGTAGSASADVITIQGVASMTAVAVSGTVTANQGSNNATPWNENVAQINGVTPLMGAGNTGTGSLRVTIASDQATLPVTQGALTTLETGQQAVTATAAVLATQAAKQVCIKVLTAGTQVVYYGKTGVTTTTGQELSPGDGDCMAVDNVNRIFVIAGSTGSTIAWRALN